MLIVQLLYVNFELLNLKMASWDQLCHVCLELNFIFHLYIFKFDEKKVPINTDFSQDFQHKNQSATCFVPSVSNLSRASATCPERPALNPICIYSWKWVRYFGGVRWLELPFERKPYFGVSGLQFEFEGSFWAPVFFVGKISLRAR